MTPLIWFWLALAGIFLIVELVTLTMDFLALSFAAILTALTAYLLHRDMGDKLTSFFVFAWYGAVVVFLFRFFIKKRIFGKKPLGNSPLSIDNLKWQKLIVQELDGKPVVYHQWLYRNIISTDELKHWDTVVVEDLKDNKLIVKKVI